MPTAPASVRSLAAVAAVLLPTLAGCAAPADIDGDASETTEQGVTAAKSAFEARIRPYGVFDLLCDDAANETSWRIRGFFGEFAGTNLYPQMHIDHALTAGGPFLPQGLLGAELRDDLPGALLTLRAKERFDAPEAHLPTEIVFSPAGGNLVARGRLHDEPVTWTCQAFGRRFEGTTWARRRF